MESSVAQAVKAHHLGSSLFMANAKYSKIDSYLLPSSQPRHGKFRVDKSWPNGQTVWKGVKCTTTTGASVSLPEKQLHRRQFGDEIITEEEVMCLGKLGDKCKEVRGIAELLECLETEAIMGEDEGKKPTDYSRRAQIFDKSSRVFQALKENSNPVD